MAPQTLEKPEGVVEFKVDFCNVGLEYCYDTPAELLVDKGFPLPEGGTEISREGFPTCWGTFARIGNQIYLNSDGSIRVEHRSEEEVIKSLNSFRNKPVTLDHPPGLVLPSNSSQYLVGLTHEDVDYHEGLGRIRITLATEKAIRAIQKSRDKPEEEIYRQLSAGYLAKVVPMRGDWYGDPYTHQQFDIEGNHVALVRRGRAGKLASIHYLDSIDSVELGEKKYFFSVNLGSLSSTNSKEKSQQESKKDKKKDGKMGTRKTKPVDPEEDLEEEDPEEEETTPPRRRKPATQRDTAPALPTLTTLNIDGIDIEFSEAAAVAVNGKIKRDAQEIKDLRSQITTLKTQFDAEKGVLEVKLADANKCIEELEEKVSAAEAKADEGNDPEKIEQRVQLQANASRCLGDSVSFKGLTNRQIQEKVLGQIYGDKLALANRSDEAVSSMYEAALLSNAPGTTKSDSSGTLTAAEQTRRATQDAHGSPKSKEQAIGYYEDGDDELYEEEVKRLAANANAPLSGNISNYRK